MSESQIFVGLGLFLALAVGCQFVAAKFGIPAIILLLPIFAAMTARSLAAFAG